MPAFSDSPSPIENSISVGRYNNYNYCFPYVSALISNIGVLKTTCMPQNKLNNLIIHKSEQREDHELLFMLLVYYLTFVHFHEY